MSFMKVGESYMTALAPKDVAFEHMAPHNEPLVVLHISQDKQRKIILMPNDMMCVFGYQSRDDAAFDVHLAEEKLSQACAQRVRATELLLAQNILQLRFETGIDIAMMKHQLPESEQTPTPNGDLCWKPSSDLTFAVCADGQVTVMASPGKEEDAERLMQLDILPCVRTLIA